MTTAELRAALTTEGGIVTVTGAASLLGVTRQAVEARLSRGTLPMPVAHDQARRPLWTAEQITALRE